MGAAAFRRAGVPTPFSANQFFHNRLLNSLLINCSSSILELPTGNLSLTCLPTSSAVLPDIHQLLSSHRLLTNQPVPYTLLRLSASFYLSLCVRHNTVRLECVMHAASVHPEPGSNSLISCITTVSVSDPSPIHDLQTSPPSTTARSRFHQRLLATYAP